MKRTVYRVMGVAIVICVVVVSFAMRNGVSVRDNDISGSATLVAFNKPIPGDLQKFMRKKLAASHQVVEGLAVEDFDLLVSGARTMIEMSKEAAWKTQLGPVYSQDTADFVGTAQQLIKMSTAENMDAAALAYIQLTLHCVRCHKHVRGEKVASWHADYPAVARAVETSRSKKDSRLNGHDGRPLNRGTSHLDRRFLSS